MIVIQDGDHHLAPEDLYFKCYKKALFVIEHPELFESTISDVDQMTELLVSLELEKMRRDAHTDHYLDYNDEIVSIEDTGIDEELMDITVSGDNLFYANGVLTKNSMGIVHSCDVILGIVRSEEFDQLNQVMFVQMKNRYADPSRNKRFMVGLNRSKMKLYDLDATSTQMYPVSGNVYAPQEKKEESPFDEPLTVELQKSKKLTTEGFVF